MQILGKDPPDKRDRAESRTEPGALEEQTARGQSNWNGVGVGTGDRRTG